VSAETLPGIDLFVFAFNEVESLETTVRELLLHLEKTKSPYELTIVDDGSNDGTGELADQLAATTPNVRVIHHATNLGLGYVWRTAFENTRRELVTFFAGDGQFPGTVVDQFWEKIPEYDMVLGYLTQHRGLLSTFLSMGERALYWALVGRVPKFQGMMMLRSRILREQPLHSEGRGWGIAMELVLRTVRGKYRMTSIPIGFRPRAHGVSKVNNVRNIRGNVDQLLALRRVLRK
jgi:dolichol-phosphate mannosyltransferase